LGKVQIRKADALPLRLGPVPIDRQPDA